MFPEVHEEYKRMYNLTEEEATAEDDYVYDYYVQAPGDYEEVAERINLHVVVELVTIAKETTMHLSSLTRSVVSRSLLQNHTDPNTVRQTLRILMLKIGMQTIILRKKMQKHKELKISCHLIVQENLR